MAKKKYNFIWLILLVLVLVVVVYYFKTVPKEPVIQVNPSTGVVSGNAGASIGIKLYDENGNEIKTSKVLSVVQGVPGVAFIGLTATATSTSTSPSLTCYPSAVTPTLFNTALVDKAIKVLPPGSTIGWTTATLINVTTFETSVANNFTFFNVSITCNYTIGGNNYGPIFKGFKSLNITKDFSNNTAQVIVSVDTSGQPSLYCGDAICSPEIGENYTTCPTDGGACAPPVTGAKFRTSDITYATGSAIAINTTACGGALTAYGYAGGSGNLAGSCVANMATNGFAFCDTPTKFYDLPSTTGWLSGGEVASLWLSTTPGYICICDSPTGSTVYQIRRFDATDPDRFNVNVSSLYSNANTELSC